MKKNLLLIVTIAILLIIFVPLIGIWCLNVLFNTGIEYTVKTWIAAFGMLILMKKDYRSKKLKDL